tara:strand:+ start:4054 stop:4569 length:516 start_codon:yes stop_codon:yes gene_type:complete
MSGLTEIKSKLLKASKTLFWKHGIKRVTVEEICDKANVNKMSFYRHFKNKEAIAQALIEQLFKSSIKRYIEIMESDDDFRIKVDKLVKLKYKEVKGISEEFINDVYKTDNNMLSLKLESFKQQKQIRQDFTQAQLKGEIRSDLNIGFMMYMLNDMNNKLLDKKLIIITNFS